MKHAKTHRRLVTLSILAALVLPGAGLHAASQQIRIQNGKDAVEIEVIDANILRVHVEPDGKTAPRTLVMDPALDTSVHWPVELRATGERIRTLTTPEMSVTVDDVQPLTLQVRDAKGRLLLTVKDPVVQARGGQMALIHDEHEELYGMCGLDRQDSGEGVERIGGAVIAAGGQGNGGAPFFFTRRYGVLIDSDGGFFEARDETLLFRGDSRTDAEYFVIVGEPLQVMAGLARLTGKPPMPPKWTLGFLNSQWGSTEAELRDVAQTYAEKQIPISGFILDFDWKAWGEDDYGEWRWNSTSGAGNPYPNKFPNGASGGFAADMLKQGIHLAGILKPRILVNRVDGAPTEAAAYATAHGFWYPQEVRENDYFTRRLAANIDFGNPEARKWYWEHLIPAFRTGITAWWNDEADFSSTTVFNNFQFLNMGRALYEGQRAISPERVWSINRAYFLGASRYGYAEWSGDISTGFQSMAYQRRRMIAALNLGVQHWSMDTGGYAGHPTSENYARWMEFAAFVPIDRVHGNRNEKRQPWVYGPVAEAAAKRALRLRYDLMPYIYSNERVATETGIGLVRPLAWIFPDDLQARDDARSWMFGDALLVSPVVEHGLASHAFYLPPGGWLDYQTGKQVSGGRELQVSIDSKTWQDIPIYVREGSILATQPAEDRTVNSKNPLILDIFPSTRRKAEFSVYDDDSHTYAYEKGEYFKQRIAATEDRAELIVALSPVEGSYQTSISSYVLHVHWPASTVLSSGTALRRFSSEGEFYSTQDPGWASSRDRFGRVALVRIGAGRGQLLVLSTSLQLLNLQTAKASRRTR